jgi:hypothetical protein
VASGIEPYEKVTDNPFAPIVRMIHRHRFIGGTHDGETRDVIELSGDEVREHERPEP